MSDRGSGRTTRQLAALPDGALYLVPHQPMARYCGHLLEAAGRKHDAVRIIAIGDAGLAERRLRGTRRGTVWDIDHAFLEAGGSYEAIRVARLILDR